MEPTSEQIQALIEAFVDDVVKTTGKCEEEVYDSLERAIEAFNHKEE